MAFRALLHASLDFIESPGLSAGKLYALDLVTRGSVFFEEMFDGDGIFLTNLNQKVVVGAGERNILASDVEEPDNILLALSVISVGDRIPAETAGEFIDIASRTTDKGSLPVPPISTSSPSPPKSRSSPSPPSRRSAPPPP